MTSITTNTLSKNQYAVLGQPFHLVVVFFTVTAIIIVFSLSLQNLITESHNHQIEQQIQEVLIEAAIMFENADEGSKVMFQVSFPSTVRYIVFGHLPRNNTLLPVNKILDENTSNNCYYVMTDGTVRSFHSNARFSDSTMTQIAVFYPGTYTITLELRTEGGKTYVTMS